MFVFILVSFSSTYQNSELIDLFVEYAKMQENLNIMGNNPEYIESSQRFEKKVEDEISILLQDRTRLHSILDELSKKDDSEMTAFLPVMKKIKESIGNSIIVNGEDSSEKSLFIKVSDILSKLENYNNLSFAKSANLEDDKFVMLVKSIYEHSINPADYDRRFKNYKGYATDIMQYIALEKNKGRVSQNSINRLTKISQLAFFKGTTNEELAQSIDTIEVYTLKTPNFVIKYQKTGKNAVANANKDDNNNNIPDYVDNIANYLEKSLKYQIEELGFKSPANAPSMEVLITDMRDYGVTVPDMEDENMQKCYIQIDNDYVEDFFATKGEDAAKVTCAHELFHSVQAMYGLFSNQNFQYSRWMAEGTAVWMEDAVWTEVDDYLSYINGARNVYFDQPQSPIFMLSPQNSYIAVMYYKFLTDAKLFPSQDKKGFINDKHILRALWEDVEKNGYSSIEANLSVFGDDYFELIKRFNIMRYTKKGVNESEKWEKELTFLSNTVDKVSRKVEEYEAPKVFGANYIKVTPKNLNYNKNVKISFSSEYAYPVTLLFKTEKGMRRIDIENKNEWEIPVKRFGRKYKEIVVIVGNNDRRNNGIEYKIDIE